MFPYNLDKDWCPERSSKKRFKKVQKLHKIEQNWSKKLKKGQKAFQKRGKK